MLTIMWSCIHPACMCYWRDSHKQSLDSLLIHKKQTLQCKGSIHAYSACHTVIYPLLTLENTNDKFDSLPRRQLVIVTSPWRPTVDSTNTQHIHHSTTDSICPKALALAAP